MGLRFFGYEKYDFGRNLDVKMPQNEALVRNRPKSGARRGIPKSNSNIRSHNMNSEVIAQIQSGVFSLRGSEVGDKGHPEVLRESRSHLFSSEGNSQVLEWSSRVKPEIPESSLNRA